MRAGRWITGWVCAVALLALGGCWSELADPQVQAFTSPQAEGAPMGATVTLVAEFSAGTGVIDQGVGEVRSGEPVTVTLTQSTTYTLTVTNADGVAVTAQLSVPVIFQAAWALDGPDPDWLLVADALARAEYRDGRLVLAGGDKMVQDPDGWETWICVGGRARHVFTDAGLVDGRFGTLNLRMRGLSVSGIGMGYPYLTVTYAGRRYDTYLGDNDVNLDIEISTAGDVLRVMQDGVLLREDLGESTSNAPGIELSAYGCASDLGGTSMSLDAISLEAR